MMSEPISAPMHVYARTDTGRRDSLAVLADWIPDGSRVLDLGCGAGSLGQRLLRQGKRVDLDGLTHNPAEAELARSSYRQVQVADLEQAVLADLFAGEFYDFIVCADVLEHMRDPQRVLQACRALLRPDGRVLISVPNVAYCGLVADLLHGAFRYRDEGLLDRTHLRFFTRESLQQLLHQHAWAIAQWEPVRCELPDSEFREPFDLLPPAVSAYLLAQPDALAYQFVVMAQAQPNLQTQAESCGVIADAVGPAQAFFTAQLYVGHAGGFSENQKIVRQGVIGEPHQTLKFELGRQSWSRLRLDLADRPGFLHLYRMVIRDEAGGTIWLWDHLQHGPKRLADMPSHQVLIPPSRLSAPRSMVFLYGNDPWIELPVMVSDAEAMSQRNMVLEVELGWPMSADYMALMGAIDSDEAPAWPWEGSAGWQQKYRQLELQNRQLMQRRKELTQRNHDLEMELLRYDRDHQKLAAHLKWIEASNLFRMTRPLVHFKMWLTGQAQRPEIEEELERETNRRAAMAQPRPVDVIIPVYRGLDDTRRCIESVQRSACQTAMRLVVINDASPEPALSQWLREAAARDPKIVLLENLENLGFVGTVNRGLGQSTEADVVLLNSDTVVANDWLDRLHAAAYSRARVASVTPFSNNATICSYPRFCEANALPAGYDTAQLDALFAGLNPGLSVEVPTGVGFCMYIRREAIEVVGLLDVENFGKGYGEENDFCQRAIAAGWVNLHALDTFVLHAGGVSFGDSKSARELAAMETLRRLHPSYEMQVQRFIVADPARQARQAVDLARLQARGLPAVLAVVHDRGGGTQRHVEELAEHMQAQAVFYELAPMAGGRVRLGLLGDDEALAWEFVLDSQFEQLLQVLTLLGVRHIHFHHLIGHDTRIADLPKKLQLAYDFTAHDYYSFCPQITLTDHRNQYCREEGLSQCTSCLRRTPAPGGLSIEAWRQGYASFLTDARYILAPSRDAARRLARFVPGADVRWAPHTDLDPKYKTAVQLPRRLPQATTPLKVAVIGALSPIKGADVLEDVAKLAARSATPLEFHLLGYAYRNLQTQPKAALTVHGAYQDEDLPQLLAWLQPDVVWFPAQWPETYSYTLSACLEAGLPIVAPDLGAFVERLSERDWTWLQPWDSSPAQWLSFFEQARQSHFLTGQSPAWVRPAAEQAEDALIQPWSYEREYLAGLSAAGLSGPDIQALMALLGPREATATAQAQASAKLHLLDMAVRLRAHPLFSRLVRRIPLRWQTRIKSWLRS